MRSDATTRTWRDIPGWLTGAEGEALAALAAGRIVLEVGSYLGRSTAAMAASAALVVSIDRHTGDEGTGPADTWAGFRANLAALGLDGRVVAHRAEAGDVPLTEGLYDLAFIDASHDEASVRRDAGLARRAVRPGGVIAFHDWDYPSVRAGAGPVGAPLGRVDSLAWFARG